MSCELKQVKFMSKFRNDILSGKKNSTWRLFDDKDLSEGNVVEFLIWETKEPFAKARVTKVVVKKFSDINKGDFDASHQYSSDEEMYKVFEEHYNRPVDKDTFVKIVQYEILE
jgi:hypothetical protein